MNLFRKEPTISFKSIRGNFAIQSPVIMARDYKPDWLRNQQGKSKFQSCPGMVDYFGAGYLILAHVDIHIRANSEGVSIKLESLAPLAKEIEQALPFDFGMVAGMAPIDKDVAKFAGKITLPWSIVAKKGFSGYAVPAVMHSNFLDKLFVYPGVVDYDRFHTVNFVFSPIEDCDIVIPAGTPLLQIIPFKREDITAVCKRATNDEEETHFFNITSKLSHYYRKYLSRPKPFKMECPYEHRKLARDRDET